MAHHSGAATAVARHPGPPPLLAAARRLNLPTERRDGRDAFEPVPGGSVPLFTDGRWVLKFFPPGGEAFARAEWSALRHLHGRVPFEVPAPFECLEVAGWSVVAMSLLAGLPARATWSHWTPTQHRRVSRELGRALRALHDLPAPDEPALSPPGGDFDAYLRDRLELLARRPERLGRDPGRTARAHEFLRAFVASRPVDRPSVLLHTEVSPEHVIVRIEDGEPRFAGFVDFEPAMVGDPLYEFAAVAWFWAEGERDRLAAVLEGYDQGRRVPTPLASGELLALSYAHRYFHRERWLERLATRPRLPDLESFARTLLGESDREVETA